MKKAIILSIFVIISSSLKSQSSNKFSLEIGVNLSRNINTKGILAYANSGFRAPTVEPSEKDSHTINMSLSAGYRFTENHSIRLRFAKNTIGSRLTGNYYSYHGGCMYGLGYTLMNELNIVRTTSLGLIYEYQLVLKGNRILVGLGIERQWNNYKDTKVRVYYMPDSNFTMHTTIGYLYSLSDFLEIHPKLFMTASFTDLVKRDFNHIERDYIPLQIGFEVGARFSFG